MDLEHEALREELGAFALGQLSADRQDALRSHLQACAECRAEVAALSALAGPLAQVDPDDPLPQTPPALDVRIRTALSRVAAHQAPSAAARPSTFDRFRTYVVPALVGAAAATIGVLVVTDDDASVPTVMPEAVPIVREADGIDASAGVIDHTWGMEINLVGSGFEADASYNVVVIDQRGRSFDSGAFVGVGDNTLTCKMNSAVLRDQAVSLAVTDVEGTVVVRADLA